MAQQQQITHTPRWLPTIDRPEWSPVPSLPLHATNSLSVSLHKFPVKMLDIARQSNRNLWREFAVLNGVLTLSTHSRAYPAMPTVPTVLLLLEMTFLMSLWLCNLDFIAVIRKTLQVPNEVAHFMCGLCSHVAPTGTTPAPAPSPFQFSSAEVVGFYASVDVEGVIKMGEQNKQLIWEMQWNTSVKSNSPS